MFSAVPRVYPLLGMLGGYVVANLAHLSGPLEAVVAGIAQTLNARTGR